MNPQPAWAEKALEKPSAFNLAELDLLREFFDAWVELHALKRDKLHQNKADALAKQMVEKSQSIRIMRGHKRGTLTVNGVQ